ncbi:MAG: PhoX family protein [Pseudomonadaceae bacterium]|nr:PhoX family protein [Pseudomonadaceae bacterium]
MKKTVSRRQFSQLAATAAAASAVAPLGLFNARVASAAPGCNPASFRVDGFGPLSPKLPANTEDLSGLVGVDGLSGDFRGQPLLRLPEGFNYRAISIRGQLMSDGNLVPGDHDGMAAFRVRGGNTALVRNHELSPTEDEAGNNLGCLSANGRVYDPFTGDAAGLGGGGTSTIVLNRQGEVLGDYVSLGGTIRNCAGGPAPWGSWISCEETVSTPANNDQVTKKHGYNFEVPADLRQAVDPIPLIAMGRMNHEAVSVDPRNGYIFQTEDRGDSAYYKFVPSKTPRRFGDLQEGGDLYAMVIDPDQRATCDNSALPMGEFQGTSVVDTRGLGRGASGSMLPFLGQPLKVSWVKLEDVDPEEDTLRFEAQAKGAAVFWRGEGAWYFGGKHYWVNSGAGDAAEGQVMCYDPKTETVTLVVESTDENLLDGPDNITVGYDGTLYLCEDGSSGSLGAENFSQRVVGVDAAGGLFDLAQNVIPGDTSEFGGGCFSPDGRFFYVNSQGVGITYVIWRDAYRPILLRDG